MKRTFLVLCVVISSLSGVSAGAAQVLMDREQAFALARTPAVTDTLVRLDALLADPGVSAGSIRSFLNTIGLDFVGSERVLYETLYRLRDLPQTPELEGLVREYLNYDDRVTVFHEEGPLPIPLFNVRTAAHGTLNFWNRISTRDLALSELADGNFARFDVFAATRDSGNHAVRRGLIEALGAADISSVRAARDAFVAKLGTFPDFAEPLAVVALRTRDASLSRDLLTRMNGPAAIGLLTGVRRSLSPGDAFDVLEAATDNDSLASAAIYEIGKLTTVAARDDFLIEQLVRGKNGATAAAVIARYGDSALLDRAATLLETPHKDSQTVARVALAFVLEGSATSRSRLRAALTKGSLGDGQLSREVQAWLGE